MNLIFLAAFGLTLFKPPVMIYRFAVIQDKTIPGSPAEKKVAAYCRKVTIVWCVFFVFNGSMAAFTIFSLSDAIWAVYNGGISYILMGILFAGEFIIRKKVQKKMPKHIPFSDLKNASWDASTVVCYSGAFGDKKHKTWKDFIEGTAILRQKINSVEGDTWLLHSEDCWYFLLAFTALLQCKKQVMLSANTSPVYLAEIKGLSPFLTDKDFSGKEYAILAGGNTFNIPSLLDENKGRPESEMPLIDSGEAYVIFWTSGTTGKPKQIKQRLKEFEVDTLYLLSKWGEEFYSRKLCSTVSQHHIYGFLFGILLPFTAAVPIKREMIKTPVELEKLNDESYYLITVPAFLKRAVEMETPLSLKLKSPYILASGGFLFPDVAQKTAEVFGCWPLELYGSTEISGIAWRQQSQGPLWIPFGNAKLTVDQDSCLVVHSTYRPEYPNGFETMDLVKMFPNGQFILMGRIDSVVKIEEKRISLPEVEGRITESGLVSDVCVIALEDTRQYLAAALVFNAKGKEKFAGMEKLEINKFWREHLLNYFENIVIPKRWRYLDALPQDTQGKKKKEEIQMLFADEKDEVSQ